MSMAEHLRDPLDYLYEELPPEGMAEVRKHLAACAACRTDMRAVREAVKIYRQVEKPAAPAGLAARATLAALEAAKRGGASQSPATPATVSTAPAGPPPLDIDKEFAKLKEEVLQEVPRGWRTWLFHPAWTVAASVIFVCAVLIHFSPRMRQMETRYMPAAPMSREATSRQIRDRERLPTSQPRAEADAPSLSEPAPPVLEEAAALSEELELPAPVPMSSVAASPAPAAGGFAEIPGAGISVRPPPSPIDRKTASATAVERPRQSTGRVDDVPALSVRKVDPVFAEPVRPPVLDAPEEGYASADYAESAGARGILAREQAEHAPSPASPASSVSGIFELDAGETPGGAYSFPSEPSVPTPAGVLESLSEKTKSLADDGAGQVVILDMLDPEAVPQIVERPPAYDPAESIRTLTTLAGMQMASGEFAEARETIGLLEKYDAEAARNLTRILQDMERRASEKEEAAQTNAPPPVSGAPEAGEQIRKTPDSGIPEPEVAPMGSVPSSGPVYSQYLEVFDPPEDPPMSLVRVPAAAVRSVIPPLEPIPVPEAATPVSVTPPVTAPELLAPASIHETSSIAYGLTGEAIGQESAALPDSVSRDADSYVTLDDEVSPAGTDAAAHRPVARESVYVETPVNAGSSTTVSAEPRRAGPSAIMGRKVEPEAVPAAPLPVTVYAPAPVVILAPAPAEPPPRRRETRQFTTDPYFRDY